MEMNIQEITQNLKDFIINELLDGEEMGLEVDTPLLEWGILDSLSMVSLLAFIEENLGIQVPSKEVKPENFDNLQAITNLLDALSKEKQQEKKEQEPTSVAHTGTMVQVLTSYGVRSDIIELPTADHHVLRTSGKKPTWVLLPALGNPSTSWGEFLRMLINEQEVVSIDLVGFGLSASYRSEPYSYEEHLEEEIQVLQKLDQNPIVLVCSSITALIGTAIARRYPKKIKALIILGFGVVEDPNTWCQEMRQISKSLEQYLNSTYYKAPKLVAPLQMLLTESFKQPAYDSFLQNLEIPMKTAFDNINVPTLLIAGEDDRLISKASVNAAAAKIAGSQAVFLARCGHFPQVERTQETLVLIQKFLKDI